MKIIFLVLLIKISKVYSGNDDFVSGHDGYTAKLENLVGETIHNDALSSLQFQPEILNFLQRSVHFFLRFIYFYLIFLFLTHLLIFFLL